MNTQAQAARPRLRTHDRVSPSRSPNSLTSISKRAGICRSHLFRILDGSRTPSLPVAHRLALALKISLDELYNRIQKVQDRRKRLTPATTISHGEIAAP